VSLRNWKLVFQEEAERRKMGYVFYFSATIYGELGEYSIYRRVVLSLRKF